MRDRHPRAVSAVSGAHQGSCESFCDSCATLGPISVGAPGVGPIPVVAPGFGRLRTRDTASDLLVVFSVYVFVGPPCLARSRSASGRRIDHWKRPLSRLQARNPSSLLIVIYL